MLHARAVGLSVALATLGCSGPKKNAVDAQAEVPVMPRTDVEGLKRLINLPCRPIDVKWATSTHAGSDNWSLRVVLHLAAEDLQRILSAAGDSGGKKSYMSREQLAWMPESVRAAAVPSGSEDLLTVDAVPIGIEKFAAPKKSPLIQGIALAFPKQNLVYCQKYARPTTDLSGGWNPFGPGSRPPEARSEPSPTAACLREARSLAPRRQASWVAAMRGTRYARAGRASMAGAEMVRSGAHCWDVGLWVRFG